ncbi:gp131 [Bacillus phage G]|uniref:Gp131 n=1 Tax=Bacillus phage G TaxID=2884420 RepID=G3MBJ3_9CAUD|nr:gp131 [Bacillus phage G]AEO93393.1 gp131 [Bacillus phage G]
MSDFDKTLMGNIDDVLRDLQNTKGVRLDKDKVEFLKMISKTKYSGLTTPKLVSSMNFLKEKNDEWFVELLDDGLVEKISYQAPTSKVRQTFEGWFITTAGRKVLKDVLKKM